MKFSKKLVFLFFAVCLIGFVGCKKDDEKVPDPEGTITANLGRISLDFYYLEEIGWVAPDNIGLIHLYTCYGVCHRWKITFCNVGKVSGLGSIKTIPTSGYANNVACEVGHGYVIKCENFNYYGGELVNVIYIRLYVVESIVSTSGGIMGAKVKYQYPFEP